jgi:putative effector of murein hydrolase
MTLMQAQTINLSFNPTVGETYSYRFGNKQEMVQNVMGQSIVMNIAMDIVTEMSVKEKTADKISMEYVYTELIVDISSPMMTIRYNSATGEEFASGMDIHLHQLYGALLGKPMNVVFGSDGTVMSVSGFDVIMDEIRMSTLSNNPAMQAMADALLQAFNEDAIKQMLEQSFAMYPQEAITIGDSWSNDISSNIAGMSSISTSTYTLVSVENNVAFFDVVSTSITTPEGAEGEMKGEFKGKMSLEIKTGMVINSNLTGNVSGTLFVQGMAISTHADSQSTVTLKR